MNNKRKFVAFFTLSIVLQGGQAQHQTGAVEKEFESEQQMAEGLAGLMEDNAEKASQNFPSGFVKFAVWHTVIYAKREIVIPGDNRELDDTGMAFGGIFYPSPVVAVDATGGAKPMIEIARG